MIAKCLVFAFLPLLLCGETPYREALPGYSYRFPRDYFEHRDFRTEWWYYTGNVRTTGGKRYGFELVFFRQGQRRGPSDNPSAWRVDDLYLAHAALTDIDGKHFLYHERLNRSGPGIAGASFEERRIWNGNWSDRWLGESQLLEVTTEDFRFRLRLTPVKPVIIQGENGVSQKAAGAGKASCYVSFPRLQVQGEIDGQTVQGTAWMDHEWFTNQLADSQRGWDWFSVQLDNGTEFMLFQLRRKDGTIDPYSSGTYVDRSGRAHHLKAADFSLEPLERWRVYPIRWRIGIPSLGVSLEAKAALPDQVLELKTGPSYWEGAVRYSGSATGSGYLEMTGYEKPVRLE